MSLLLMEHIYELIVFLTLGSPPRGPFIDRRGDCSYVYVVYASSDSRGLVFPHVDAGKVINNKSMSRLSCGGASHLYGGSWEAPTSYIQNVRGDANPGYAGEYTGLPSYNSAIISWFRLSLYSVGGSGGGNNNWLYGIGGSAAPGNCINSYNYIPINTSFRLSL